MNILIIAMEAGRWGPVRLAKPLGEAGFQVASLCSDDNPLARTRFVDRRFTLAGGRSSRRLEADLARAMRDWRPRLVIPADEQVVAWLHALVRNGQGRRRSKGGGLDAEMLATVQASLGRPDQLDAMLFKTETLRLARHLGVRTPAGVTLRPGCDAMGVAESIGFPLYVKNSFSWAGQGLRYCADRSAAAIALSAIDTDRQAQKRSSRALVKRLIDRDWYPTDAAIDLQRAIEGTPAMYCAVALGGKSLAGFAGFARHTLSANGPSTVVRIQGHPAMAAASEALIAAMGASGFIGFDFMIQAGTGDAYLLECNPRPIQVGHLGPYVGVDLCASLAAGLRGEEQSAAGAAGRADIALFPQEWLRDPAGVAGLEMPLDAPWDDPDLLRAMMAPT